MRLTVDPEVWARFPGLCIVVVTATDVDNATPLPAVTAELAEVEAALRAGWAHESPQSHPRIAAWREAFKILGVSTKKHASSIEALARRVLGGKDLPRINPLVDFYNTVSLRHLVPAGGWDTTELTELRLAFTRGGERFREMGSDDAVEVAAGELAYLSGNDVVTRHFVWRQSELGKVTPSTRDVLLLSEILPGIGDDVVKAVRADLVEGLMRHFAVTATARVVDVHGATVDGN